MISEFQRDWRFLSNFWPCNVMYAGHMFPSAEHAYVAAKVGNRVLFEDIKFGTAGQAKAYGRTVPLPKDWDVRKVGTMLLIVQDKFTRNLALRRALLATGDEELQEGNRWGDRFWGVCPPRSGQGKNQLGKILMQVRKELRHVN